MADDLTPRIVALAEEAAADAATDEAARELRDVAGRVNGPIRLAIAGKVKAGKSTLLNAIIGEELAPTDAGECTRIVTWYRHSDRPYAKVFPVEGDPVERRTVEATARWKWISVGSARNRWTTWRSAGPRAGSWTLVLIDTPGIASISTDVSAADPSRDDSRGGPRAGRRCRDVSAAPHALLRRPVPGVLPRRRGRARDSGQHRRGALPRRRDRVVPRRRDAGGRSHCAPIPGRASPPPALPDRDPGQRPARTRRGDAPRGGVRRPACESRRASDEEIADVLLTADRFAGKQTGIAVPAERRARLLERLGLFGVRLSVEQIRSGAATSSSDLSARLADVSGLQQLRERRTAAVRVAGPRPQGAFGGPGPSRELSNEGWSATAPPCYVVSRRSLRAPTSSRRCGCSSSSGQVSCR